MNVKIEKECIRIRLSEQEFREWAVQRKLAETVVFPGGKKFIITLELSAEERDVIELEKYALRCQVSLDKYQRYASGKMGKKDAIELREKINDEIFFRAFIEVDLFKKSTPEIRP